MINILGIGNTDHIYYIAPSLSWLPTYSISYQVEWRSKCYLPLNTQDGPIRKSILADFLSLYLFFPLETVPSPFPMKSCLIFVPMG